MEDVIKLKSRYREKNYLRKLEETKDTVTYILDSELDFTRYGTTNSDKTFIDPSGGPMIIEGEVLEEAGTVVKELSWIKDKGFTVTFKK